MTGNAVAVHAESDKAAVGPRHRPRGPTAALAVVNAKHQFVLAA
jgi:hypothetical protein